MTWQAAHGVLYVDLGSILVAYIHLCHHALPLSYRVQSELGEPCSSLSRLTLVQTVFRIGNEDLQIPTSQAKMNDC